MYIHVAEYSNDAFNKGSSFDISILCNFTGWNESKVWFVVVCQKKKRVEGEDEEKIFSLFRSRTWGIFERLSTGESKIR